MIRRLATCLLLASLVAPAHAQTPRLFDEATNRIANTTANLDDVTPTDGAVVTTFGAVTKGDGGAATYVYHATGKAANSITTDDFGWYIDGAGDDDYYEAVDRSKINAVQFGFVEYDDDNTADNTAALLRCLKARAAGNHTPRIDFPAGQFRFASMDVLSGLSAAELETARGFYLCGACPVDEQQGDYTTGLDSSTVFLIDVAGATDADFWLERISDDDTASTFFGIIRLENIRFQIPTGRNGSFINMTSEDVLTTGAAFRGLQVVHCRFDKFDHPYLAGYEWGEDDATLGCFKVNARDAYGIKLGWAYDVQVEHCTFRGLDWPLYVESSEGITLSDNRYILNTHGPVIIDGGTKGHIEHQFVIGPAGIGIVCNVGNVISPSVETGYPSYLPYAQPQDLDTSGIDWSITANASTIVLSDFPVGYDATDILMPWSAIKVTPSDTSEPARIYVVYDVTATGATLLHAGADTGTPARYMPCNAPTTITGTAGNSLVRMFGVNGLMFGDEVAVFGPVWNRNADIGVVPLALYAPLKRALPLVGETYSAYVNNTDPEAQSLVLAHHLGDTYYLGHIGVIQSACDTPIDHPLAVQSPDFPAVVDANTRKCRTNFIDFEGVRHDYGATPGYGRNDAQDNCAELFFRRATATDSARLDTSTLWVVKPSDNVTGSVYSVAFPVYAGCSIKARVWADGTYTGANGLSVYDGVGSTLHDLTSGWQTITQTLDGSATTLTFSGATNGGAACEISEVSLDKP